MITIIVDNMKEYYSMQKMAEGYVCREIHFYNCLKFPPDGCAKCYGINHLKYGIRVIAPDNIPIDNKTPDEL